MGNIKENVAENLSRLRQEKKLTQSAVATRLNYSDKAVSKWECGETTPPIDVLKQLADLYEVSLDYLVEENPEKSYDKVYSSNRNKTNKIIITLLFVSIVWLVATVIYVYSMLILQKNFWLVFVYSVPVTAIVLLIINSFWGKRRFIYILVSILIWTILASIYLSFISYNVWGIFIIGAPLQIASILWSMLIPNKKREK